MVEETKHKEKHDDERCLEDMKKEYEEIRKKYNLPEFDKLNQEFYIEKSAEVETDYLLREIRRTVSDKLVNYLRFFEAFMNPPAAPVFVQSILKTLDSESRETIQNIYKKLSKREVDLIDLDLNYDEKKEAEFIKSIVGEWDEIKKDLTKVLEQINKNWDAKVEGGNKDYFS